ncbi:right-handed parallel beta-helix repeat-containing protein [Trichormus azollae]|uniref:right-handed parallel beta-helix repeat-containing protein n=1 Tax=Trichormus azollae TaxID=1164 RepID=UPI00325D73A3
MAFLPLVEMPLLSISKNYFYQNAANGITVSANFRPEVWENVFQNKGFAINVAQNASPIIVGNQISNNRSGIVVQANIRPILRKNVIQSSKKDGLVIIDQAIPYLGNSSEPGGNQFRNNTPYHINTKAAKQVVFAGGNNISKNCIIGNVDINATKATIVRNSATSSVSAQQIPTGGEIVFAEPNIPRAFKNNPIPKIAPTNLQNSVPKTNSQSNTPLLNYVRVEPRVIEFTAAQASNSIPRTDSNSSVVLASKPYTATHQG